MAKRIWQRGYGKEDMAKRTTGINSRPQQQTAGVSEDLTLEDLTKNAGTRYRNLNPIRLPFGEDLEMVYSAIDSSVHVLHRSQAELLSHCQEFRTIDEHTHQIRQKLNGRSHQAEALLSELASQARSSIEATLFNQARALANQQHHNLMQSREGSIKKQLSDFVESGLLISDIDVSERYGNPANLEEAPPQITSVGVVTKDRPESLKRCLVSYIENSIHHGEDNDFVVMDDSESFEVRDKTREMLRGLSKNYAVNIAYGGVEEKTRFVNALSAESGIPLEVVNFALFDIENCGRSTGANRNALLLHTTGDLIVSVDDDTICRFGTIERKKYGLTFDSQMESFMHFQFFPNRESALQSVDFKDESITAIHERVLGKRIAACIWDYSELKNVRLDRIDSRLLSRIWNNERVVATSMGVVGDSGMHSPVGYLRLIGDSREDLVKSESSYRSACISREMLRIADRVTITDTGWCLATALGLDNRFLLPPFLPVCRNQDGLFGLVIQTCFEYACFGHLPVTIIHSPMEERRYEPGAIWKNAGKIRFCDVVVSAIASFEVRSSIGDPRARLSALGKHLSWLGALELPEFEELVRLNLWKLKSNHIVKLESLLKTYKEKPHYWADDVRKHIGILRESLVKKEYIIPWDLSGSRNNAEASFLAQKLIGKFGQLLHLWPSIVDASKALRTRSCRLAKDVNRFPRATRYEMRK